MKRPQWTLVAMPVLLASMAFAGLVRADFEVAAPDGRRILVKDDGTWQYLPEKDRDGADKPKDGEAVLVIERLTPRGNGCRLAVRLANKFPFEIRSLVPYYSVYRADGVIYDTSAGGQGFAFVRPGDSQGREIEFAGIACNEISRVRVSGGGRCQMGDLDRFSATPEQCLSRVRVEQSSLVRFDK